MADSLSSWLLSTVVRTVSQDAKQTHVHHGSNDSPFVKGSKVQIIRFLGFGPSGQQLDVGRDDDEEGVTGQNGSQDSTTKTADRKSALWAIVGDRTSWVCVKFSKECVTWFDSVHTRSLLSLRGSIFALRWFRPAVSFYAARMYDAEAKAAYSGPFAAASSSDDAAELLPRLYLDVQTIQLWGSINETIFHETDDLQSQILPAEEESQESDPKRPNAATHAVRFWFATMSKRAQRKASRQARLLKGASATEPGADVTSTSDVAMGTSDESSQQDSFPSVVSLPPAFQRPASVKRRRPFEDEPGLKRVKESAENLSRSENDGWDGVERKWADDGQPSVDGSVSVMDRHTASDESNFTLDVGNHATSPLDLLVASSNEAHDRSLEGWRMSDEIAPLHTQAIKASSGGVEATIASESSTTDADEWSQNTDRDGVWPVMQAGPSGETAGTRSQVAIDDADDGKADKSGATNTESDELDKERVEWNDLVDLPED